MMVARLSRPIALVLGRTMVDKTAEERRRLSAAWLNVVAAGLVLMAIGVVMLGTFPPTPQPHAVEKVVPNDRFSTH